MPILERLQSAIKANDDKEINRISHEIMAKEEEIEDQGLSEDELNHVVGACMRTDFPNFATSDGLESPYGLSANHGNWK